MVKAKKKKKAATGTGNPELDALIRQHRALREEQVKIREEMSALEDRMRPLQNKAAAVRKLKAAGLSQGEIDAISAKEKDQ